MENENYSKVWERVFGGEAPDCEEEYDDKAALRQFMDYEAYDALYYKELAKKYPKSSRVFLNISADEAEHLRRLRTAYYIMQGEIYMPEPKKVVIKSLTSALRERYLLEKRAVAGYRDAADKTREPKLREIYLANAGDEAEHQEIAENMLRAALS